MQLKPSIPFHVMRICSQAAFLPNLNTLAFFATNFFLCAELCISSTRSIFLCCVQVWQYHFHLQGCLVAYQQYNAI